MTSCLLLLFLATKTTLYKQNLLSQQNALVMTQHICCVSKICRLSNKWADSAKIRNTLWPDADRIWTLTGIWFLSCGSGAHFDRCGYIIDLTQYWILEYTFSRWSSNSCAVSAKTCWVTKILGDDSV